MNKIVKLYSAKTQETNFYEIRNVGKGKICIVDLVRLAFQNSEGISHGGLKPER